MPHSPDTPPDSSGNRPPPTEQNLRFILGLKLNQLRKQKGQSLKEVAGRAGIAISYLNEIEKGKKYPKPEKILSLAKALGTTYDELVSLQLGEKLHPLSGVLKSGILEEIPLEVFGLTPLGLLEMMAASPDKISALFDTFVKIAHRFDVTVEHLLLAAMRSYVEQNKNYFEDIELAAENFRQRHEWARRPSPDLARLQAHLSQTHGYTFDETTLASSAALTGLRAITLAGDTAHPRLLLNPQLGGWQKAFLLAREIGYRELGLRETVTTSPLTKVESFDQLLNNFRASYFAGALLLDRQLLVNDLRQFFARATWDGAALVAIKRRYQATPEMFFHRLSQIVPHFFGLEQMYFVRFDHRRGTPDVRIGKELHYQRMHASHSIGVNEHYCRRWVSLRSLHELELLQSKSKTTATVPGGQRSRFYSTNDDYFSISLAHPHSLEPGMNSCVTLGFLVNDALKKTVNFWNDPALPVQIVGDTCERCALTDCTDRIVPSHLRNQEVRRAQQLAAVAALTS
ncbi:MAG: helix-turn-helix domain-containing protein [Candidatus Didemnitutus sp.]|nr:helix-turn-helix domain-containing protein [Candidatus Didemnitutus sp.]